MSTEDKRSTAEIQADLAASRAKLVSSVESLVDELNPKNVAKRAVDDAKTFVSSEFRNAKNAIKDENGWKFDKLIPVGGAVLGAVVFVLTIRAVVNKSRGRQLMAKPPKQLSA